MPESDSQVESDSNKHVHICKKNLRTSSTTDGLGTRVWRLVKAQHSHPILQTRAVSGRGAVRPSNFPSTQLPCPSAPATLLKHEPYVDWPAEADITASLVFLLSSRTYHYFLAMHCRVASRAQRSDVD